MSFAALTKTSGAFARQENPAAVLLPNGGIVEPEKAVAITALFRLKKVGR